MLNLLQVSHDRESRELLARWQAKDGVREDASLSDPPLLALEIEASTAEMQLLQHLVAVEGAEAETRRAACDISQRLFQSCQANMERFEGCGAAAEARSESGALRISNASAGEVRSLKVLMRVFVQLSPAS
jgi:hypothetical protein